MTPSQDFYLEYSNFQNKEKVQRTTMRKWSIKEKRLLLNNESQHFNFRPSFTFLFVYDKRLLSPSLSCRYNFYHYLIFHIDNHYFLKSFKISWRYVKNFPFFPSLLILSRVLLHSKYSSVSVSVIKSINQRLVLMVSS